MMELIYTSSSKGVDKGSQGYCTVACSESMPPLLKINLENMSGYSWIYPPHDKDFNKNPVNYSYVKVKAGHEYLRVLSRIGINGLDYSGRPNKIAHFICFDNDDTAACDEFSPSQIINEQNTFVESWDDTSQFSQKDFCNLSFELSSPSNAYWEEITGNGAWAAYLGQLYRDSPDSNINVIYDSHVDPLRLISEATSLLTPEEQWDITFSTYFSGSSLNSVCNWRFILRDSKYHEGLKSTKDVIDLNDLQGQMPETDLFLDASSDEALEPMAPPSQRNFKVSSGSNSIQMAKKDLRSRKQKMSIIALLAAIVALTLILFNKDALLGLSSPGDSSGGVQEEEPIYSFKIEQKLIPKGGELEKFGDVLITINIDDFLAKLRIHKKVSLDIFAIPPEKIETSLVSTKHYKIFDNVISKLYIEKKGDDFIQNKKPLIGLKVSKELIIESLSDIDESFIDEFKENIKKMKVNRVIFEFIEIKEN